MSKVIWAKTVCEWKLQMCTTQQCTGCLNKNVNTSWPHVFVTFKYKNIKLCYFNVSRVEFNLQNEVYLIEIPHSYRKLWLVEN